METTKELTVGQKLSEVASDNALLIMLAFTSLLVGALAVLLEQRALISPTMTSATWFLVGAALVIAWVWTKRVVTRMANIYNADYDQRQAATVASAQKLEWLRKYVKQVQAILDNPNWKYYLESVAQYPTRSTHIAEFEQILKSLLGQMAEVLTLDESGLVYSALTSRIIGDLKWALQYTHRAKAEPNAGKTWNTRIANIESGLM